MRAAQAARCANEQGQYWKLREIMSANPDKLDMDQPDRFATDLKMDAGQVPHLRGIGEVQERGPDRCHGSDEDRRQRDAHLRGRQEHAEGVDGEVMIGAMPFAMFDEKLKSLQK